MPDLTPEAQQMLATAAQRHGFSPEAALTAWHALAESRGAMAQFNHPELGGVGQWAQGGMTMVGDMFNHGLKARVDALCSELAGQMQRQETARVAESAPSPGQSQSQSQGRPAAARFGSGFAAGDWWPAELGTPASSGAQNGLRYAYFPGTRRLAIQQNGRLELYDTGDHRISGVSQQQGGAVQDPSFSSDRGPVRLADLRPVDLDVPARSTDTQPSPAPHAAPSMPAAGDPLALIERLAELRQKGVITEAEFTAKKTELLSRL